MLLCCSRSKNIENPSNLFHSSYFSINYSCEHRYFRSEERCFRRGKDAFIPKQAFQRSIVLYQNNCSSKFAMLDKSFCEKMYFLIANKKVMLMHLYFVFHTYVHTSAEQWQTSYKNWEKMFHFLDFRTLDVEILSRDSLHCIFFNWWTECAER